MAKRAEANAGKMLSGWLSDYLPSLRMVSDGTIEAYEESMQIYHMYLRDTGGAKSDPKLRQKGILAANMSHFNSANIRGFVDWLHTERGNSSRTISLRLAAIRSFLEYAAIEDISYAPMLLQAQRVKIGKIDPGRLVGHMSEKAWEAVVAQPKLPKRTEWRNWVFMILMYEIAGRNSEIIGLRACDLVLDGDEPCVYVWGKGNKEGVMPIRESVAEILKDYVARFHPGREKSEDPLFYVRREGAKCRMSPDCSEAFLKRYGESARESCPSVPERVHPHLIRYPNQNKIQTFATSPPTEQAV